MPTRPSRKAATLAELARGQGDPVEAFAPAPGMKEAREAAGVSLSELSEMTGYSSDLLAKIEAGDVPVPRITTSRISAALATEHTAVRGEGPQEVTRLKDIQERTKTVEHVPDHHVLEENFHPAYAERETLFRDQAAKLWDKESNARAQIRTDISLSEEERMDQYIAVYGGLEKTLDELSGELGREEGKAILEATETLYGGGSGKKFSEHLASVANVPDERLESLMNTAVRSGQGELARAIAVSAYERGGSASTIFNSWAEAHPERAAALERLTKTPGAEQMATRTKRAMTPPKAALADLIPTHEDERRAAEAEAASNVAKYAEFFGPTTVPRQVGGRRS